jgi:hypothetical protein
MRPFRNLWLLVISTLGLALPASGAVIVGDSFEYADQAAFEAAWPIVAPPGGTLTTDQAASGAKSIHIGTAVARNGRTFAETAATSDAPITFSYKFYDVAPAVAPFRQYMNIQDGAAPSLSGQLISMGLNNNLTNTPPKYMARVLGFSASAYFKLDDPGSPDRSLGWHELTAVISPTQIQFYVDDILSKTVPVTWENRSYDVLRLGSGVSSTQVAYYDDVLVSTDPIPEPAALGLIALAAGMMLSRRRV